MRWLFGKTPCTWKPIYNCSQVHWGIMVLRCSSRASGTQQTQQAGPQNPFTYCTASIKSRAICHPQYEAKLLKVVFCLAFLGAFRVGESVATSCSDIAGQALSQNELQFTGGRLVIWIHTLKIDQMDRGASCISTLYHQ